MKPERSGQKRDAVRERWWQYCEKRPGLYRALTGLSSTIVRSLTSKHHTTFIMCSNVPEHVFDQTLIVFTFENYAMWALLTSRIHEVWTLFLGVTLEDRPLYNVRDCFETFPFPENWYSDVALEAVGLEYYQLRAAIMAGQGEGLTKIYNRFHDRDERNTDILRLRDLHEVMDRAVFETYGWSDLAQKAHCEFLLDYEDEEDEDIGHLRKRKKPWRYRWPDEIRDEVLTRLLELNVERAKEERLENLSAKKNKTRKPAPSIETSSDQQRLAI